MMMVISMMSFILMMQGAGAYTTVEGFYERLIKPESVEHQNLLDRAISIFSHGMFDDQKSLVQSVSMGLAELLPTDRYNHYADIDFVTANDPSTPQAGAMLRLRARPVGSRSLKDMAVVVDLEFGCEGVAFKHHVGIPWPEHLNEDIIERYESGELICVPTIHISHTRLDAALRSRGFTSSLFYNLVETLTLIQDHSKYAKLVQTDNNLPAKLKIHTKALSGVNGYSGGVFWAKQGFSFASQQERREILEMFYSWLVSDPQNFADRQRRQLTNIQTHQIKQILENDVIDPIDLLQLDLTRVVGKTAASAEYGQRFLSADGLSMLDWLGEMPMDNRHKGYRMVKEKIQRRARNSNTVRRVMPISSRHISSNALIRI